MPRTHTRRSLAALALGLALGVLTSCGRDTRAAEPDAAADLDLPGEWRELDPSAPRDGRVSLWYESGARRAEGSLADGLRQGVWTFWRADGSLRWGGEFERGIEHGVERGWYPDGRPWFEGERVHGERSGRYRYWHPNGVLELEAEFAGDQRHGECRRYTLDGELDAAQTGRYEHGRRVGPL